MIPYSWLGAAALFILWTHTLLIAAVALMRARSLRERFSLIPIEGIDPEPLTEPVQAFGKVAWASGFGPQQRVAVHRAEHRGRQIEARVPTIGWFERSYTSEVFGGAGVVDGRAVRLEPAPKGEAWPAVSERERAQRECSAEAFEGLYQSAGQARGTERQTELAFSAGSPSYLSGWWKPEGAGWVVLGDRGTVIISRESPRKWSRRCRIELWTFAAGVVLAAALITGLCLVPPVFGPVSTLGGVAGLGFFLLVQPAGTWIRDRTLDPGRRPLYGRTVGPAESVNDRSRSLGGRFGNPRAS